MREGSREGQGRKGETKGETHFKLHSKVHTTMWRRPPLLLVLRRCLPQLEPLKLSLSPALFLPGGPGLKLGSFGPKF